MRSTRTRALTFVGSVATVVAATFAPAASLAAHGGQYRGPVPGGSFPAFGMPNPGAPGPAGPTTPISGAELRDVFGWDSWWAFHAAEFLRLKTAVRAAGPATWNDDVYMGPKGRLPEPPTLGPSRREVVDVVLPALRDFIERHDERDIQSAGMVAIAKIGLDHPEFATPPLLVRRLQSNDQEVRETAALALGISQRPEAIAPLTELLRDSAAGRELCSRGKVDARTRAFAAFGLGLAGHAAGGYHRAVILETLATALGDDRDGRYDDRDLRVALVHAIGAIQPEPGGAPKDELLRRRALDALWAFWSRPLGRGDELLQAHVPPAVAAILGRGGDRDRRFMDAFARELSQRDGQRNAAIQQSAAIALGLLARAPEVRAEDAEYSAVLRRYFENGKDRLARHLCLVAMAEIGGNENRGRLLQAFARSRTVTRGFAALALGVLAFRDRERGGRGPGTGIDIELGRALHDALRDEKAPDVQGALATGLGLAGYQPAAPLLEELLERYHGDDQRAGAMCIGLGLMRYQPAVESLRRVLRTSLRRPELLRQAATALAILGDKEAAETLVEMLLEPGANVARLSALAGALGWIGDRRSVAPLVTMLGQSSLTPLSRAFVAVALGGVCDKAELPWNQTFAAHCNYAAAVPVLTDGTSGILDIL